MATSINREARYEDLVKATGGNPLLAVQNGTETSDRKARVTKLVIVSCYSSGNNNNNNNNNSGSTSSREFALIFSMSHAVADGHDYYKLFHMIAGPAPVEALDPRRVQEYETREAEWTGEKDYKWLTGVGMIKGVLNGLLCGPKASWCCYMVDDAKVREAKARAVVTKKQGEDVSFVSTNDVITSHFCNATNARVAMMVTNMRGKINLPVTDLHAGNYSGCLLLDPQNYCDPAKVRNCLTAGFPFTRQTPSSPLPGACGRVTMALITSWASFPFELQLETESSPTQTQPLEGSGIYSQDLHLPCMAMPDMMDVAIVFKPKVTRNNYHLFYIYVSV